MSGLEWVLSLGSILMVVLIIVLYVVLTFLLPSLLSDLIEGNDRIEATLFLLPWFYMTSLVVAFIYDNYMLRFM